MFKIYRNWHHRNKVLNNAKFKSVGTNCVFMKLYECFTIFISYIIFLLCRILDIFGIFIIQMRVYIFTWVLLLLYLHKVQSFPGSLWCHCANVIIIQALWTSCPICVVSWWYWTSCFMCHLCTIYSILSVGGNSYYVLLKQMQQTLHLQLCISVSVFYVQY
jgi:hypothetical protein